MRNTFSAILLFGTLATALPVTAECDSTNGRKQYNKCIACHSVEPGESLMGPRLHGLIGRQVGAADGFFYSEAMGNADFIWTEDNLAAFVENPAGFLPGNVMPFGGIRKQAQRDALVCYISQLR